MNRGLTKEKKRKLSINNQLRNQNMQIKSKVKYFITVVKVFKKLMLIASVGNVGNTFYKSINSFILPVRMEIEINLFDGKSKNYAYLYLLIWNQACNILLGRSKNAVLNTYLQMCVCILKKTGMLDSF